MSAVVVVAFAAPMARAAEMGRAPVSSGVYVTGEGGYALEDGADVLGYTIIDGSRRDVTTEADDGWYAGGSIGWVARSPFVTGLPFNRAEAYFTYTDADGADSDRVGGADTITLKNVDGTALAVVGVRANADVERKSYEGGVRLVADPVAGGGSSLTWAITPFVRFADEDSTTTAIGTADTAQRSAEVETWMYGVMAAVEPEVWLNSTFALVGRLGIGVYGYRANGDFNSSASVPAIFDARLSDDDSGAGFRGQLGAGLKFKLAPAAVLTGYAEADYFSAVGTAAMPANRLSGSEAARVETDDAWEFRAGARLSIGLGGSD